VVSPAYADSGNVYISPSSSSVQIDQDVSVDLRINPGTAVNAVQATLNYNPSQLQFLSSNPSAFSTCVTNTGGSGTVTLACASLGSSVSSDSLISDITFEALVGSASDTLTLSGVNAADDGTYTNPTSTGGTITFTSPTVSSSSSSSSSSKTVTRGSIPDLSGSSTGSSTASTSTPTPTPPATPVSTPAKVNIASKVTSAQFNVLNLDITTSTPVQCYVSYGLSKSELLLSTTPTSASTNNTVSLDPSQLVPGTTYYYQVAVKDASGNITKGPIESITTKGYTLSVTVLDSHYHPLANQEIVLHSTPYYAKTNAEGVATFYNVSPGVHHVEYSPSSTKTVSEQVYVNNSFTTKGTVETAQPQSSTVVLTGYKVPSGSVLTNVLIAVLLIILAAELGLVVSVSPLRDKLKFARAKVKNSIPSSVIVSPRDSNTSEADSF